MLAANKPMEKNPKKNQKNTSNSMPTKMAPKKCQGQSKTRKTLPLGTWIEKDLAKRKQKVKPVYEQLQGGMSCFFGVSDSSSFDFDYFDNMLQSEFSIENILAESKQPFFDNEKDFPPLNSRGGKYRNNSYAAQKNAQQRKGFPPSDGKIRILQKKSDGEGSESGSESSLPPAGVEIICKIANETNLLDDDDDDDDDKDDRSSSEETLKYVESSGSSTLVDGDLQDNDSDNKTDDSVASRCGDSEIGDTEIGDGCGISSSGSEKSEKVDCVSISDIDTNISNYETELEKMVSEEEDEEDNITAESEVEEEGSSMESLYYNDLFQKYEAEVEMAKDSKPLLSELFTKQSNETKTTFSFPNPPPMIPGQMLYQGNKPPKPFYPMHQRRMGCFRGQQNSADLSDPRQFPSLNYVGAKKFPRGPPPPMMPPNMNNVVPGLWGKIKSSNVPPMDVKFTRPPPPYNPIGAAPNMNAPMSSQPNMDQYLYPNPIPTPHGFAPTYFAPQQGFMNNASQQPGVNAANYPLNPNLLPPPGFSPLHNTAVSQNNINSAPTLMNTPLNSSPSQVLNSNVNSTANPGPANKTSSPLQPGHQQRNGNFVGSIGKPTKTESPSRATTSTNAVYIRATGVNNIPEDDKGLFVPRRQPTAAPREDSSNSQKSSQDSTNGSPPTKPIYSQTYQNSMYPIKETGSKTEKQQDVNAPPPAPRNLEIRITGVNAPPNAQAGSSKASAARRKAEEITLEQPPQSTSTSSSWSSSSSKSSRSSGSSSSKSAKTKSHYNYNYNAHFKNGRLFISDINEVPNISIQPQNKSTNNKSIVDEIIRHSKVFNQGTFMPATEPGKYPETSKSFFTNGERKPGTAYPFNPAMFLQRPQPPPVNNKPPPAQKPAEPSDDKPSTSKQSRSNNKTDKDQQPKDSKDSKDSKNSKDAKSDAFDLDSFDSMNSYIFAEISRIAEDTKQELLKDKSEPVNNFGLLGLSTMMRGNDPTMSSEPLNPADISTKDTNDLFERNNPHLQGFTTPFSKIPRNTPNTYPNFPEYRSNSFVRNNLRPIDLKILHDEIIMYLFYSKEKQAAQMQAGAELIRRNWRYHKDFGVWLKAITGNDYEINGTFMSGRFYFFDFAQWKFVERVKDINLESLEVLSPLPRIPSIVQNIFDCLASLIKNKNQLVPNRITVNSPQNFY